MRRVGTGMRSWRNIFLRQCGHGQGLRPFYRLEAEGLECVLADAKQVKHLPGPGRDPPDSRWLAACFERGAVRSCLLPDPEFRVIRLRTRYRRGYGPGMRGS